MKTTLNLPAGKLLWQVFPLHLLKDKVLTCKEICGNCLQSPTVYQDAQDIWHELDHKLIACHSWTPLLPSRTTVPYLIKTLKC